jgi:putative endonuclease
MRQSYVYILFNQPNGTLYVGVTSNLVARIWQHKVGTNEGFTKKYGTTKLGYFEAYDDIGAAIAREKQLKAGSRANKLALIERANPQWRDLYTDIGM